MDKSASSSSSSSALFNFMKYDVYLSFTGEDIRRSFASHLYGGLTRNGIGTIIDESPDEGNEIRPALLEEIQSSHISIIIFSKDYASSSLWLDELVHIVQCRQINRQVVVPVYYEIDPSDVRRQRGHYGTAFAQLEKRFRINRVHAWRAALKEAANISGWDLRDYGSEAKLVEKISGDISDKLIKFNLKISIYPLGYDVCHEYASVFLQAGSDDVLVVGITGESKMGKTVLAKAIYDGLFRAFDASSFVIGVGQKSKEPSGMVHLQEKILYDLLGEKMSMTNEIERLRHKRVLIVLDDVDDLSQLFDLVGNRKRFDLGSKILITSTDLHLLLSFKVDQLFKAQGFPLPVDIQEICEPYQQSCCKITGLKEYIQSISYAANEKAKYVEECLIRDQRRGGIQDMNKAASSSLSALPNLIKYDVFLSFRGGDTRSSIISHLYAGLTRNSIKTFVDEEIEKGQKIDPMLVNVIS